MVSGTDNIPSKTVTHSSNQPDEMQEGWGHEKCPLTWTLWGCKNSWSSLWCSDHLKLVQNTPFPFSSLGSFLLSFLLFLKGFYLFGEIAHVGFWEMLQGEVLPIISKYYQEIYLFVCFSHSLTSLLPNAFFFFFFFLFSLIFSREGLPIAFP